MDARKAKTMERIWSLCNESKLMFAVAYGKSMEDAIARICREINENGRATAEHTSPEEWVGEEFTKDSYGGVLIYY